MKKIILFIPIFYFYLGHSGFAQETLSLEQFLKQVKNQEPGLKANVSSTHGGILRSEEGSLLLTPTLFVNFNRGSDAKLNPFSIVSFDNLVSTSLSIGISQLTSFGLQAKIHYDLSDQTMANPLPANFQIPNRYTNASPVLELTQNLWSNGFGVSTKANQIQLKSSALASSYSSSYQAKVMLSRAEMNYWRLAVARQAIGVQQEALTRAHKIYEWNQRRARLQLGDQSDVLQAEALVQSRELDLTAAQNEERSASRAFNEARNVDTERVSEQIIKISPDLVNQVQAPKRALLRDDVKAAQQQSRASQAMAEISSDRDRPTLDLIASFSLNGQPGLSSNIALPYTDLSQSIGPSFSFNRPTATIGLRFSVPLAFGTISQSQAGWKQEQIAAALTYDQKVMEQEHNWKDLNESLGEAKQHLTLSRKLELIQGTKLTVERDRLKKGRTTTYQVLLFEQDFLLAQLMRIRDQFNVLNLIAQMKQFGETL